MIRLLQWTRMVMIIEIGLIWKSLSLLILYALARTQFVMILFLCFIMLMLRRYKAIFSWTSLSALLDINHIFFFKNFNTFTLLTKKSSMLNRKIFSPQFLVFYFHLIVLCMLYISLPTIFIFAKGPIMIIYFMTKNINFHPLS